MWIYNEGDWYTNEAGNSIWYVERNPCRCCPDSYFIEYKSPVTGRRTVRFDVFSTKDFNRVKKQYGIRKLC